MKILDVKTKNKDYDIIINNNFDLLQNKIEELGLTNRKVCIITDDNVGKIYLEKIRELFENISLKVVTYTIPHGEINKNLQTVNNIYTSLIEAQLDRESVLVALGGGVTGDIVGFTAATYMRGIRFIQIPTTLLSQVDSSIGGKTGVDFNGYKNIIGAFYQPELVYINTSTVKTLPSREFSAGMAEVIKHGLICNKTYFDFLINNVDDILNLESDKLEEVIYESCKIKSYVVSQDEKEHGLRATLNFGHTIGHAVERLLEFKLLHGECVSIGAVAAAYLSNRLGQLDNDELEAIKQCFTKFNLPVDTDSINEKNVLTELYYDKKTKNNIITFILLKGIGTSEIRNDVNKDDIIDSIKYIIN